MANGAKVEARGPGWIATLLGTAVLVVGGFALGLVAGVVSEEPGLVVDYVSGQTDRVEWSPDAESPLTSPGGGVAPAEPRPDEPPILRKAEARAPAPTPEPTPAPPAAPAVASGPPAGGRAAISGFAVQVGAFAENGAAERIARDLRGKGFPVYVTPSDGSQSGRWRVRVGPVDSRKEADQLAMRLKTEERLPTWVLEDGAI